jgi:hypothetical protein
VYDIFEPADRERHEADKKRRQEIEQRNTAGFTPRPEDIDWLLDKIRELEARLEREQ